MLLLFNKPFGVLSQFSDRSDPAEPTRHSTWPDGGRPRSATVVIRKRDGGVVGG